MNMHNFESVVSILTSVLQLGEESGDLTEDSVLLGAIPEFDSMAVVSVITALEEKFDFFVEDDEIDAEVFETVGSLVAFVESKLDD